MHLAYGLLAGLAKPPYHHANKKDGF